MMRQWMFNAVSRDLNSPHESHTRLRGRALAMARSAWLALVVLVALLFVVAIPARAQFLHTLCEQAVCIPGQLSADGVSALRQLGLSLDFYATYLLVGETAYPLLFSAVGAFIFWRKSDDWIALFVSVALILLGTTVGANFDALAGGVEPGLVGLLGGVAELSGLDCGMTGGVIDDRLALGLWIPELGGRDRRSGAQRGKDRAALVFGENRDGLGLRARGECGRMHATSLHSRHNAREFCEHGKPSMDYHIRSRRNERVSSVSSTRIDPRRQGLRREKR